MNIVIVEDELMIREGLQHLLEKLSPDYHILAVAEDGKKGVEMIRIHRPDLVITDVRMPNMDGLEALKAIKGAHPEANIVMCSAMGQESMVIEAIKSGAKDFIVKPFKPERILATAEKILS